MSRIRLLLNEYCYECRRSELTSKSAYFNQLLTGVNKDVESIQLPEWMRVEGLCVYLEYILTGELVKIDVLEAQMVLWICDYFCEKQLLKRVICEVAIPGICKGNVLLFAQDAYTKIKSGEYEPCWDKLLRQCLVCVRENFSEIFERFTVVLCRINEELLERILGEVARYYFNTDSFIVIEKYMKIKNIENPLDVLKTYKQRSPKDSLVYEWNIGLGHHSNSYANSGLFNIDSAQFYLFAWTFSHEKVINFSLKRDAPQDNILSVNYLVQVNGEFIGNSVISTALFRKAEGSQEILHSVPKAHPQVQIKLYAVIDYVHSTVLNKLSTTQSLYLRTTSLHLVPYRILIFLLSSKKAMKEDHTLKTILRWVHSVKNLPSELELSKLLNCVQWEHVTLPTLLYITKKSSLLRNSSYFAAIFKRELFNKIDSNSPERSMSTIADIVLQNENMNSYTLTENSPHGNSKALSATILKLRIELSQLASPSSTT